MLIPKVVHRIWFGPEPVPDDYVRFGEAWERFGYEVRHWSEANLPELVNRREYDACATRGVNTGIAPRRLGVWTQRADLVSYELVWRFGGIYSNMDMEPRRPFDDLLDGVEAFAGKENNDSVCNALFGATAGHPFVAKCVELAAARFWDLGNFQSMQQQTGPGTITAAAAAVPDVRVFPTELFYPFSFEDMSREHDDWPDAFAVHHWGHTRG